MNQGLTILITLAKQQGWGVKRTCKGWGFYPPNGGQPVHTHATPSDFRAILNLRTDLRKAGLNLGGGK